MTDQPLPALVEAAKAICRALDIDPDAATSSAYAAAKQWEQFLPYASLTGASFAGRFRTMAEEARSALTKATDQVEAERLKVRADALHEAAEMLDELADRRKVVAFRRKGDG